VNVNFIQVGTLSQARGGMAVASAGNKIVFAGGHHSLANGSQYVWGSPKVDIYDIVSQTWSTAQLSEGRSDIAAIAAGNKIFFAGGSAGDGAPDELFSTVDIYDASTNSWSRASLSEPRSHIAAATVGNKVFFAGGNIDVWNNKNSDRVDVYDLSSNSWSTMQLSGPRENITAVTTNNKIYFAGGWATGGGSYSDRIDIYDNATSSWTTSSLMEGKAHFAGIALNNKIYWAGGQKEVDMGATCLVEIKDVNTGNTSVDYLSRPASFHINGHQNAVVKDNKIIYYGNRFDIYDVTTNTWSIGVLPKNITGGSIISVNNTIYLAGGDKVWKLQF